MQIGKVIGHALEYGRTRHPLGVVYLDDTNILLADGRLEVRTAYLLATALVPPGQSVKLTVARLVRVVDLLQILLRGIDVQLPAAEVIDQFHLLNRANPVYPVGIDFLCLLGLF